MGETTITPAWDSAAARAIGHHREPRHLQRLRFAQRVVRTVERELVAPDGSVHRVEVPLVELVTDGTLERVPRRGPQEPRRAK